MLHLKSVTGVKDVERRQVFTSNVQRLVVDPRRRFISRSRTEETSWTRGETSSQICNQVRLSQI